MERGWIIYKKNKARTQTTEWANGTSSINNKYIKKRKYNTMNNGKLL